MPKADEDKIIAENLLDKFIAELDTISSNGVVRHPDTARISDLREHYINQCQSRYQIWLAEQIDTILSVKLHYFEKETRHLISPEIEKRITEKIRSIVRQLKEKTPNYIGWLITGRWFNPAEIVRSFLQPAVSNTILSFSLLMSPPTIEQQKLPHSPTDYKTAGHSASVSSVVPVSKYQELEQVRSYSGLYNPVMPVTTEEKKTLKNNIQKSVSLKEDHSTVFAMIKPASEETLSSTIATVESPKNKIQLNRLSHLEIRPMSDIQSVFYLNEQRLKNCFYSPKTENKIRKIPLRFEITPSGKTKNIRILDTKIDSTVADKITLQIYQFRFNRVDESAGDQLVFYTLFF